jgi:sec-independent protein translocase protein TatB
VFDVGLPEILVLMVVAVLVFGPDRLPEMARQAARFLRSARQVVDNARREISDELGTDIADLRELDPRRLVRKHILDVVEEDSDDIPRRPGHRPLLAGERPPFDEDAT